jgi:chromosome segregation ATPase
VQGEHLDVYVEQYTKLQQALLSAHESEQKLVSKCQSLGKQIRADSQKLTTLFALHDADKKRCAALRSEIEVGKEEKKRLAEQLHSLRTEIKTTQQTLDDLIRDIANPSTSSSRVHEEETAIRELEQRAQTLTNECHGAKSELTRLRERNVALGEEWRDAASMHRSVGQDVTNLQAQLRQARATAAAEEEKRAGVERTLREGEEALALTTSHAVAKEELVAQLQKEVAEGAKEVSEAVARVEATKAGLNAVKQSVARAEKAQTITGGNLTRAKETVTELKNDVTRLRGEEQKLRQLRDEAQKRLDEQRQQTNKLLSQASQREEERTLLESAIASVRSLTEGRDGKRMALRECEQERTMYVRAREVLHQSLRSSADSTQTGDDAARVIKATVATAKREVKAYEGSIRALQRVSDNVATEVNALKAAAAEASARVRACEEEGEERGRKVQQLQQQLTLAETQLRDQTRALGTATTQRGEWSKKVWAKRSETKSLKLRVSRLTSAIARIVNGTKHERALCMVVHGQCASVHAATVSVAKQNRAVDDSITNIRQATDQCQKKVEELRAIVARAESAVTEESRAWTDARRQEASAARELVERTKEVAVAKEEARNLKSLADRAREAYDKLVSSLESSQRERDELLAALSELNSDEAKWKDMAVATNRLKDAVNKEQGVVSALQRAAAHPLNVHRWRQLAATDTTTWALLKRIHRLQRRSRVVTTQLAEKDRLIEVEEKTYAAVRKLASSGVGDDAAEELRAYAAAVRDRQQRYHAVCKERTQAQHAAREEQQKLEDARTELSELKEEYWERMRKEQKEREPKDNVDLEAYSEPSAFASLYAETLESTPASQEAW